MNKSWWWLAALIVIGVFFVTGVLWLITRSPRGKPVELLPPPSPAPVTVYISGAVLSPGLVNLSPGSRVNDAIQAAGGFTQDADTTRLNLAKMVEDGEHINVPSTTTLPATSDGSSRGNPGFTPIDINTASLEELDLLPEIGLITAQEIINYRLAHGPFTTVEDIMDVPGIGQGTFDKIQDLITTEPVIP